MAGVEEAKAAKPAVKRTRKPAAEKIDKVVTEEETEEKSVAKKTGPAPGTVKHRTVKAKKTPADVTEEPTAEK